MLGGTTYRKLAIFYIAFVALYLYIPSLEETGTMLMVLSIATFVFAIILGFMMSDRYNRLNDIRDSFRKMDSSFLFIYQSMKFFGKTKKKKCRELIDAYLVAQFDYKLEDFDRATPALFELQDYVSKLTARTNAQRVHYDHLIYRLESLIDLDRGVTYKIRARMSLNEWGSLYLLAGVIWFGFLMVNAGSALMLVLMPILATTLMLLLQFVHELDKLTWQSRDWIWEPNARLFYDLDLLPYYPAPLLRTGNAALEMTKKLPEYRLATYAGNYPSMKGKKVKRITNKI